MPMISRFINILTFLCLIFIFDLSFAPSFAMDQKKGPGIDYTPKKVTASTYGGYTLPEQQIIKDVRVKPCVSLGGNFIDQVNTLIKEADEFVIVFIYRLDSPNIIKSLSDKYIGQKIKSEEQQVDIPVIVFLDHSQVYNETSENSRYYNYVKRLLECVPVSLVKLGSAPFHQKVILTKKLGQEAFAIVGSANLTIDADNSHSEDISIIQSNKVASIYFQEFEKLLRMEPKKNLDFFSEQTVKIFHKHRFEQDESNIEFLKTLGGKLLEQQHDTMNEGFGYSASITSLAISTGFYAQDGNKKCWNVVKNILEKKNDILFLFENYISVESELGTEILTSLNGGKSKSKLIVFDDNEVNDAACEKINKKNTTILKFKPYPGDHSKFHHKLIIQYPRNSEPIVYTGSFHLSTNAIQRNSETIIGIQGGKVADDYLASILENSGLGEIPLIWNYLSRFPQLRQTKLLTAAQKINIKCKINMDGFIDKLQYIRNGLFHDDIMKYIDSDVSKGSPSFDGYIYEFQNATEGVEKLGIIENLQEFVFREKWFEDWWKKISKKWDKYTNQSTSESDSTDSGSTPNTELPKIATRDFDLNKLPAYDKDYEDIEEWLTEVSAWLESTKNSINNDVKKFSLQLKKAEYKLELVKAFPEDADLSEDTIYVKQVSNVLSYKFRGLNNKVFTEELKFKIEEVFVKETINKVKRRILEHTTKKGYTSKSPPLKKKQGKDIQQESLNHNLKIAQQIKEALNETENIYIYLKDLNDLYDSFQSFQETSFWVGKFLAK